MQLRVGQAEGGEVAAARVEPDGVNPQLLVAADAGRDGFGRARELPDAEPGRAPSGTWVRQ